MDMNPKSSNVVLIFAFGLVAVFFTPWVRIFGIGISGYDLGVHGSYGNYAWIIPIFAGATILLTFAGINNRRFGMLSGIVSLVVIACGILWLAADSCRDIVRGLVGLVGFGDVVGPVLSFGVWLTVILSIAIIVAARSDPSDTEEEHYNSSDTQEHYYPADSDEEEDFAGDSRTAQELYEEGIDLIGKYQDDLGRKLVRRAAKLGYDDAIDYMFRM